MQQKVLVIDDSNAIHALVKARLSTEPVDLHFAHDGNQGLAAAVGVAPDLILLDIDMPHPDGFEVCRQLKEDSRTINIPVVFLSGMTSTEEKIKGLELGATDYITKPFDPAELRARVRATLRTKYLLDLLSREAMIDGLTGLWNRAYLDSRLNAELSLARRTSRPLACVMLDLDHFKQHNDSHGHPFGDEVLRSVGQILTDCCRIEDVICRYGGEEFAILAPNTSSRNAAELAERVRRAIEGFAWKCRGSPLKVTCSLGVADLQLTAPPGIIELADAALYQAKNSGRNRVAIAGLTDMAA